MTATVGNDRRSASACAVAMVPSTPSDNPGFPLPESSGRHREGTETASPVGIHSFSSRKSSSLDCPLLGERLLDDDEEEEDSLYSVSFSSDDDVGLVDKEENQAAAASSSSQNKNINENDVHERLRRCCCPPPRKVRFSPVLQIRTLPIALGDHPCCVDGMALATDAGGTGNGNDNGNDSDDHDDDDVELVDLETHEQYSTKRRMGDLRLTYRQRRKRLQEATGLSLGELLEQQYEINCMQREQQWQWQQKQQQQQHHQQHGDVCLVSRPKMITAASATRGGAFQRLPSFHEALMNMKLASYHRNCVSQH